LGTEITTGGWFILGLAAIIFGISKTAIPGLGILAIPLVTLVIPARASTGLILPMLILADCFAVAYYRRHADWWYLVRLIPWTVVGVIVGYWAMDRINDQQLRPLIGVIVLVMLTLHLWRQKRNQADVINSRTETAGRINRPWFAVMMGILAGMTTMMANAAGPIMMIYLLAMRLPKAVFLGTGAWYFLLVNVIKVPFSVNLGLINPDSLKINLLLAPVIISGAIIGMTVAWRIPEKGFNTVVIILTAVAAIKLLF